MKLQGTCSVCRRRQKLASILKSVVRKIVYGEKNIGLDDLDAAVLEMLGCVCCNLGIFICNVWWSIGKCCSDCQDAVKEHEVLGSLAVGRGAQP